MIIVGLLLLAAAVVAAVELIVANDQAQITVHMWRWSWTVEPFWLAVAGAAILLAALLGLYMLKAGGKRGRRLRRERRELAKENRQLAKRAEVAEASQPEPVAETTPSGYVAPASQEPQGYVPPAQTSTTAPRDYATPADPTYADEQAEGRHINH